MASANEINAVLGAMARNPALVSQLQTELDTLVASVALSDSGGTEMVNGSGNGMAYTAQITMSKRERMGFLQAVLDRWNAGTVATSYAHTRFS